MNTESSGTSASGEHALPLADHRQEATAQRQLQEKINSSPFIRQFKTYQALTDAPVQRRQSTSGLPGQLQSGIEQLSGLSMQDVKVHYNSPEPATVQAHAFAQGRDIHLAPGQERHLPHEAWHVVQQQQGRVRPTMQLKERTAINDDASLEREADVMGEKASQLSVQTGNPVRQRATAGVMQRVIQRAPADFADHAVLRLPAKTGLFRTSYWEPLRNAVLAYSTADPLDTKKCRRLLREMAVFADRWKVARGLTTKPILELNEDEQNQARALGLDEAETAKVLALMDLEHDIQQEYLLVSNNGRLVVGAHTALDALPDEPELTFTRTESDHRKRGYFLAATQVKSAANADLGLVAANTLCRVTESPIEVGGTSAKLWYKVRPAPGSDRKFGPVTAFPEGYVKKDQITAVNLDKDASDKLEYEDRFSPALHPLFQGLPTVEDVEQSALGDCYLLAALLPIVRHTPQFFLNSMVDHGDGVVSVRLYEKPAPNVPYQEKIVHVRKSVVIKTKEKHTLAEGYNKGAIWVQLLEKAYIMAGFTGDNDQTLVTQQPSWSQLPSGSSNHAFGHLTGQAAVVHPVQSHDHIHDKADTSWAGVGGHALEGALFRLGPPRAEWNTFTALKEAISAALADLKNQKDEVRLEDAERTIRQVRGMTTALANAMVQFMRAQNIYPGKRGKALYTATQLETFSRIITGVRAHSKIVAGTNSYIKRTNRNRNGQSGGENVHEGLAGPHGYEVIDFSAHGVLPGSTDVTANRTCWIKLRNPWGKTGRVYQHEHVQLGQIVRDNVDQTQFQPLGGKMIDTATENAEFWMPLEDFTKRFSSLTIL